MKLIPIAIIFASAIFCSAIRNRIDPTPTPLPLLSDPPAPTQTPLPTPAVDNQPKWEPDPAISGDLTNGKAISLPKPEYPLAAKAVRASGLVKVDVSVDENGRVGTAKANSGHPLLRQAAEQAAKQAIFEPALISGRAVKVNGVVTYNFIP